MKNKDSLSTFIISLYKIVSKIFIIVSVGLCLGGIFYLPFRLLNLPIVGGVVACIVILIYGIAVLCKLDDENCMRY